LAVTNYGVQLVTLVSLENDKDKSREYKQLSLDQVKISKGESGSKVYVMILITD